MEKALWKPSRDMETEKINQTRLFQEKKTDVGLSWDRSRNLEVLTFINSIIIYYNGIDNYGDVFCACTFNLNLLPFDLKWKKEMKTKRKNEILFRLIVDSSLHNG